MIDITKLLVSGAVPPGLVLRPLPAGAGQEWHLVRQVQALANAAIEGQRGIVFGVEHGAGGQPVVVGLSSEQCVAIERQRDLIATALDPAPVLTLVLAEIGSQRVMALLLTDNDNPPYVTNAEAPAPLRVGECWLFADNVLRAATRSDLDAMYATRRQRRGPLILVGLGDDPRCESLDLRVPDYGAPPSVTFASKLQAAIAARQTVAAEMGREDTAMARLVDARVFGPDARYDARGLETLRQSLLTAPADHREADLYHRCERAAVQLNLSLCAAGDRPLQQVTIELTVPELPGFAVVPRLVAPPGVVADQRGYPEVQPGKGCVKVRSTLRELQPGRTVAAFRMPLRLAVTPAFAGQKIAIRYALAADQRPIRQDGRLRIRFSR